MANIFAFTDYVKYLESLFEDLKKRKKISGRDFGKLLGYQSPSFSKSLFSRERGIHDDRAREVAHRMGLNTREIDYFETLVRYDKLKKKPEGALLFKQLESIRSVKEVGEFCEQWYAFFRNWKAAAVFQALRLPASERSAAQLAKRLDSDKKEIEDIFKLMIELKIAEEKSGVLEPIVDTLRTPRSVPSALRKYYQDLLKESADKLDLIPLSERLVMGITLATKKENLPRIEQDFQDFIRTMNSKYGSDSSPDQVYHLGVQWMPLLATQIS